MGITERREREKIERRKDIIDCAKKLILSYGIERVSMEDIANKAELSKATLYLYFPGKEALLNEICEDSAQVFMEHFGLLLGKGLTGTAALKCFWRIYVELFGNSDEIIIIFLVRNYLDSWLPLVPSDKKSKSPKMDAILDAMKNIIEQCKAEGVFDPDLNSSMATRLLLSTFSIIVEKAARSSAENRKSPGIIEELTYAFQTIIRGFTKEGINLSHLDISST